MIKFGPDITVNGFTFPSSINGVEIKLGKANDRKHPAGRYVNVLKTIFIFPEFLKLKPEKHYIEKVILHEYSHYLQYNYFDIADINLIKYLFNHNFGSFNDYSLTNRKEYTSEYMGYGLAFVEKWHKLPSNCNWTCRDDTIFHYIKYINELAIMKMENEKKELIL